MVWHHCPHHKLKSSKISGQIFGLMSSFLSNRWLRVESHHKWEVFTRIFN